MIRHIVVFSFKPDAPEHLKQALLDEYSTFPSHYPAMRNFQAGHNISERDGTFEYGFTVEFETVGELKSYLNSPSHEEHVSERFRPLIARRAIVSFEVGPAAGP